MATWTTTWTLRCMGLQFGEYHIAVHVQRPPAASLPSLRCAALQDDWPRRSHPASSLTVPQHRRALFRRTPQLSAAPFPLSTFPSRSCRRRRRRRRPAPFLHAITVPLYGVPSAYLASSLVCRRRLCPTQSTQSTPPTTRPPLALHSPTYQPIHRPLTRHAPARARFGSPMASCATLSSAAALAYLHDPGGLSRLVSASRKWRCRS
jgi:hypothetical protein